MISNSSIRHGPLTFSLPEGWFDTSQVVAMGPEEGGFRSSLVVSLEPLREGATSTQLATSQLRELQRVAPDFTLVAEQPATYGGKEGVLREHTFTMQGLRVAQLQFCTVKNGVGFTFTYTQRADRLPRTRAEAEAFFASARVGPGTETLRLGPIRA